MILENLYHDPDLDSELDDEIEFTAKVIKVQPIDEKSKSVSLVMHQFLEDRWKELIALISGKSTL